MSSARAPGFAAQNTRSAGQIAARKRVIMRVLAWALTYTSSSVGACVRRSISLAPRSWLHRSGSAGAQELGVIRRPRFQAAAFQAGQAVVTYVVTNGKVRRNQIDVAGLAIDLQGVELNLVKPYHAGWCLLGIIDPFARALIETAGGGNLRVVELRRDRLVVLGGEQHHGHLLELFQQDHLVRHWIMPFNLARLPVKGIYLAVNDGGAQDGQVGPGTLHALGGRVDWLVQRDIELPVVLQQQ